MPVNVSDSALYMQFPSPVVRTGFSICNNRGWHLLDAHVSCRILGNMFACGKGKEFSSLTTNSRDDLNVLKCTARSDEVANGTKCDRIC